ncbi:MAG: hypothetical protein LBT46_00720, partial [Planctomycetaceae bacterium]|nr:hypothetical protein [Planctomycetaceae bacterium]
MYLEGIGFRGVGRVLDISYGTVFQWIKKAGKAASPIPKTEDVQVMELDEMHTYVGKKNYRCRYEDTGGLPLTGCGSYTILSLSATARRRRDEVMGQDKGLPNELDCFGLLAKLRRVCSAGETLANESGNLY